MIQYFEYNGETSASRGLIVKSFIKVQTGSEKSNTYNVGGQDGSLYENLGVYDDVEIDITVMYRTGINANEKYRQLKRWLFDDADKKLILSDDPEWYWDVQNVSVSEKKILYQNYIEWAEFEIKFTCRAFSYSREGAEEHDPSEVLYNPYDTCHPKYIISGSGECTLTVNGNTFTVTVDGNVIIDSDLMITYRWSEDCLADMDGTFLVSSDGTLLRITPELKNILAYSIGDYADLYLNSGDNTITITDGFELIVIPNWRCR